MADPFIPDLISPCGLPCGVCYARLRRKTVCPGCRGLKENLSISMMRCQMKFCTRRTGDFCFECDSFPCNSLKHLDRRYRTRYTLSPIANLEFIRDNGLDAFLQHQRERWQVEGGLICMHDGIVYPTDRRPN